jgi:hypothetical protein
MTPIDLTYPKILELFPEHLDPKRTESAAFLIWYLENYLRLDQIQAVDSVCDQKGDKGVDGIYINEDSNTIEIYQSKISQKKVSSIGDTSLKEFEGTLNQFKDADSIRNLMKSAGKADVAHLIARLDLENIIDDYDVKGVFLSNTNLDSNGSDYLKNNASIKFVGKKELVDTFISSSRNARISKPATFDISGYETATYIVDKDHSAIIAPLKAAELVKLDGITNQALFAFNVRGPLGRTQVNRDIAASVRNPARHKLFPLFHNGITIIANEVKAEKDRITIQDYYVVNGCQSLSELYNNAASITDQLRVLVKLIRMEATSPLSADVTSFSNNQNGVKARDFKSNNPIQIRLQNEFNTAYKGKYFYEIKRGEESKGATTITNEDAGLLLMAFDLKKPWATHRKYQVFEDEHAGLFGRPGVTAHRIVLYYLLMSRVEEAMKGLKNSLFAKYALTKYILLYIFRLILDDDPVGDEMLQSPQTFTLDKTKSKALQTCIDTILSDVVIDLNAEVEQLGEDFDYRDKMRDEAWVRNLSLRVVAEYRKLVARARIDSLSSQFAQLTKKKKGK